MGYCQNEGDGERWEAWCRHPVKSKIDAWDLANPGEIRPYVMLEEDLALWVHIGLDFRPSQFGFLLRLQDRGRYGDTDTQWPEHEDAFSLFCDLILVQKPVWTDGHELTAWSDGTQYVYPCLLGRRATETVGMRYALLELCGFVPHYWAGDSSTCPACSGFNAVQGDQGKISNDTREENYVFPHGVAAGGVAKLCEVVLASFSGWRCVFVNVGETSSSIFYIGERKASKRWIGVGQSDYH